MDRKILFKYLCIALTTLMFNSNVSGQSKEELEKRKQKTEKEIKYVNSLLKSTKKKKRTGYNQLLIINKKIEIQESLIENINYEINILNNEIISLQDSINNLSNDLEVLKREYSELLKHSYKRRNKYDYLVYIFSAEDFSQAFNRLKYIQQYEEFRETKAIEITTKNSEITKKLEQVSLTKAEKHALLIDSEKEAMNLGNNKNDKSQLIVQLKKKEKQLKREIEEKRKQADRIDREIKRIIEEEIRKAEELARKNNMDDLLLKLTPEEKLISDNFAENKTRLPWPTERGIITSSFGIQAHPVLKGVNVENNGIDISTTEGSYARSIFKGKVAAISYIEGINNIILVKHGNYYSVYTNLTDILVSVNDEVNEKQLLGKISYDNKDNSKTYLNFQIWKEKQKLDPKVWLAN